MVARKHRSAKPKRHVCKIHPVSVKTGKGRVIQARITCRGKITMTKAGRKRFNQLKCKCRKKTRSAWARGSKGTHRKNPRSVGNEGTWFSHSYWSQNIMEDCIELWITIPWRRWSKMVHRRKTLRSKGKCYRTVHHRATKHHRAYVGHKRVKCTKSKRRAPVRKTTKRRSTKQSKCVRKAKALCGCK
jgi:hypothetical protein